MEEKFNLEFSFVELKIILKGLEELPYKQSAPVRNSLINQYEKIQKEKELEQKKEKEENTED